MYFHLIIRRPMRSSFFFFNDTATTEIYTLSLHDALPIYIDNIWILLDNKSMGRTAEVILDPLSNRSEEHTSELQSRSDLVCRLLLEKKKNDEMTDRYANAPLSSPKMLQGIRSIESTFDLT